MDSLEHIVKRVVHGYAVTGANLRTVAFSNDEQHFYAVNIIDTPVRKRPAGVMVMARVEGDKVIIEEDLTDRPLVDALVRAGIPREQIVLAYAGDPIPATRT
jgi:hypothetical protein